MAPPFKEVTEPVTTPAAAVANVDLSKIGSILNSLSSVMKNTGKRRCWNDFF